MAQGCAGRHDIAPDRICTRPGSNAIPQRAGIALRRRIFSCFFFFPSSTKIVNLESVIRENCFRAIFSTRGIGNAHQFPRNLQTGTDCAFFRACPVDRLSGILSSFLIFPCCTTPFFSNNDPPLDQPCSRHNRHGDFWWRCVGIEPVRDLRRLIEQDQIPEACPLNTFLGDPKVVRHRGKSGGAHFSKKKNSLEAFSGQHTNLTNFSAMGRVPSNVFRTLRGSGL